MSRAPSLRSTVHKSHPCGDDMRNSPEVSFRKRGAAADPHHLLRSALRMAFPEARSDNDLSEKAAEALLKEAGEPITDRAVRKWLAGDTFPRGRNLIALGVLIGAETVMDILFGKGSR